MLRLVEWKWLEIVIAFFSYCRMLSVGFFIFFIFGSGWGKTALWCSDLNPYLWHWHPYHPFYGCCCCLKIYLFLLNLPCGCGIPRTWVVHHCFSQPQIESLLEVVQPRHELAPMRAASVFRWRISLLNHCTSPCLQVFNRCQPKKFLFLFTLILLNVMKCIFCMYEDFFKS